MSALTEESREDEAAADFLWSSKTKRIRTGWCNFFGNGVCGEERGRGTSQTSGHDVVPSPSLLFLGRCSSERVKIIDARLAAAFRDVLGRQTISLVYSRPLSSRRYEPHSYTALSSVVTGARALANPETPLPGTLFPLPQRSLVLLSDSHSLFSIAVARRRIGKPSATANDPNIVLARNFCVAQIELILRSDRIDSHTSSREQFRSTVSRLFTSLREGFLRVWESGECLQGQRSRLSFARLPRACQGCFAFRRFSPRKSFLDSISPAATFDFI